jgi:hypothetical protein
MGAMSLSTPDVMQIHQGHEHGFSAVSNHDGLRSERMPRTKVGFPR